MDKEFTAGDVSKLENVLLLKLKQIGIKLTLEQQIELLRICPLILEQISKRRIIRRSVKKTEEDGK